MDRALFLFSDLHGIARGKILSTEPSSLNIIGFSSGVFTKDIYGNPVLFNKIVYDTGSPDIDFKSSSIRKACGASIFGEKSIHIGSTHTSDCILAEFDVRKKLKKYIESKENTDILIGAELEFYLLGKSVDNNVDGQAYCFGSIAKHQDCIDKILSVLDSYSIKWNHCSQENDLNQIEIALTHSDPLTQADNIFLARFIIKSIAKKYELDATFLPVVEKNKSPSNLHLHISHCSLPIMDISNRILNSMPNNLIVLLPTVNSRLISETNSFNSKTYNILNSSRFSTIRTLDNRVELRTPSSDCNPYLVILYILYSLNEKLAPTIIEDSMNFDFHHSLEKFSTSNFGKMFFSQAALSLFKELKESEFEYSKNLGSNFENLTRVI